MTPRNREVEDDPRRRGAFIFFGLITVVAGLGAIIALTGPLAASLGYAAMALIALERAWRYRHPVRFSMRTMTLTITVTATLLGLFGAVLWRW
jgi:hypothetical protein